MGLKRSSHAVYDAVYHLVWCPKYRKNVFVQEEIRERAGQLIREICEEYGFEIEEMEVAEDHDFDTDRDVKRAYELQPQTYLGNFKSIKDVKPGDDVVFTYLEKTDGRRVISIIVKEQHDDDDEEYETPNEESSETEV